MIKMMVMMMVMVKVFFSSPVTVPLAPCLCTAASAVTTIDFIIIIIIILIISVLFKWYQITSLGSELDKLCFFLEKRNEETYWPKLLFRSYICIHTFIHSYMYVQNKLFFFALGKSPNYDIARDLNLIPEVGHLATASSSILLQNYIRQVWLKNWRDAKSWVGLWPGWGWSGIIITVRQQHTRKLSCVTRESKEERLN